MAHVRGGSWRLREKEKEKEGIEALEESEKVDKGR